MNHYDYLVVGAGFAGAVLAERLNASGKKVLVIDKRNHIGGNAYDTMNEAGILMHQYGPHIFHTNSKKVFDYLSRFTGWRTYEHRVLASVKNQLVPIPINRTTLNLLYNRAMQTDEQVKKFLTNVAQPREIYTSEDVVISIVGQELYELFFRGYTRKQWGLDPSQLDKSVTARIPTRTNTDDRYFTDKYQAMPLLGYTYMFNNILQDIDVELEVDFKNCPFKYDKIIFTGPIDEYFDYTYSKLPYRSLQFEHKNIETKEFQSVGTVNYPDENVPYTRISEYKHITGQPVTRLTTVTYEFPSAEGDPYYPIPRPENQELYKKYETLALAEKNVKFIGRLATYKYYNMDQVIGQALSTFEKLDLS